MKLDEEPADSSTAKQLSDEVHSLPLCIAQVAVFCRETSQTVSEYIQTYRNSDSEKLELLSHEFGDLPRDPEVPNAVLATWMISFNQIQRQDPRAADMISLMSVFDRQSIPKCLLQQRNESTVKFGKAIGTLKAFSLVTANAGNESFDVHRLVYSSTRYWLGEHGEQERWIEQALESRYPNMKFENRDICVHSCFLMPKLYSLTIEH